MKIDLVDLTCPTYKDTLGENDKVFATDGENVYLVPNQTTPEEETPFEVSDGVFFINQDETGQVAVVNVLLNTLSAQDAEGVLTSIFTENKFNVSVISPITKIEYPNLLANFNVCRVVEKLFIRVDVSLEDLNSVSGDMFVVVLQSIDTEYPFTSYITGYCPK